MKRVMCIDWGAARVGLAVSDELGLMAHPRRALSGRSLEALVAELLAFVVAEEVTHVLVGRPIGLLGHENASSDRAQRLAQTLAARGLSVELVDERFSSQHAKRLLQKPSRDRIDSAAAATVLQAWLDGQQNT